MPELEQVPYLLYEKEDNGILWIKFNRPERLNAVIGGSDRNGTLTKVVEYMKAGDDEPGGAGHCPYRHGTGLLRGRGHQGS